jgi:hypothetical protein
LNPESWKDVQRLIADRATEREACEKVGITVPEYREMLSDPDAFAGHALALDLQTQSYEALMRDRAINGTKAETFDEDGRVIKSKIEYDNELLKIIVQARDKRYKPTNKTENNVTIDFGNILSKAEDRKRRLAPKVIDVPKLSWAERPLEKKKGKR